MIWFDQGTASTTDSRPAEIGFLAPELVAHALTPGQRFVIREGSRTVAEGVVTAVGRHS
jgi:translation elongation factor EF-Tu-like GTPase